MLSFLYAQYAASKIPPASQILPFLQVPRTLASTMRFSRVLAASAVLFVSLPAIAQYSIGKIEIKGGAPYSDAEINSIAGLQSGQMLTHNSLTNAAQHLLDTGLFDDTEVSLQPGGSVRNVVFALKPYPAATLLPASFSNFVWLTPEDISAGLRANVPLYRGACADAGSFCDSISAGLTQLLAAKGITAKVAHNIVEPTSTNPTRHVLFYVASPSVRFGTITLTGGPAALMPDIQRIATRLNGSPYSTFAVDALYAPLSSAGYLKLQLDDVKAIPTPSPKGFDVNYSAHITEGAVYKVSAFTSDAPPHDNPAEDARRARFLAAVQASYANSHASAKLPPLTPTAMQAGDPASVKTLQAITAGIVYDLRAKGYLDAYVDPHPMIDDSAHTVAYALHTVRGEQYRLKSVTPNDLSPAALDEFHRAWTMKPGDIYNADFVANFIPDHDSFKQLNSYSAAYQASADPNTHLVDLTITFFPSGGR